MNRKVMWLVLTELAILMGVVALVDAVALRMALALAIGLLLVQRALDASREEDDPVDSDRRRNHVFRGYVSQLLMRLRQLYATAHLMATGQISEEKASTQLQEVERELQRLMTELLEAAKTRPERITIEALTKDLPLIT